LEACANHEGKLGEVLTALSANASHGILMTLYRGIVANPDTVADSLVDAVYAFFALVTASNSNVLISAGLLPLLLDMLATQAARRDSVSRS
jgi:E3 ubiquitin-protein ligase HUWE1